MPAVPIAGAPEQPLYRRVADRVAGLIDAGTLRPGDRVPSVRRLSRQLEVSVSTVVEAYRLLEDRGMVEARPQSGFYVRPAALGNALEPRRSSTLATATVPEIDDFATRVMKEVTEHWEGVSFGSATPNATFLPVTKLNRLMSRVVRLRPDTSASYDTLAGYSKLRTLIARRSLDAGCALEPDDVITTAGAQQALAVCLRAVTKPGDLVAIETPTYHGLLEVLQALHLNALEIATDPREGICLVELEKALDKQKVAAVALIPSYHNPLGHCMSDDDRGKLVKMITERKIPLIEDDVYGELPHEGRRPRACKAFDEEGYVMLCSSFSKTIAPGYRVGWAVPGRFREAVERQKFRLSISVATPTQMAIAEFLADGGFDRHIRRLRRNYRDLSYRYAYTILDTFPKGTRVSRPSGGHVLWVEMPEQIDSTRLYDEASSQMIRFVPGPLFSATDRYRNFLRINTAKPFSDEIERALQTLGKLAAKHR